MIALKHSVKLDKLSPQCLLAICNAQWTFMHFEYDFVVTSINDGKHSEDSLHYEGHAFDCRSKHITSNIDKEMILAHMRATLGHNYDVLLEGLGTKNEHYHIEYDPK